MKKIILLVGIFLILISSSQSQSLLSQNEIKVMTFNIRIDSIFDGKNRWLNREKMVFDVLVDNAADIIGLQELKYPQIQKIQKTFPQYSYYGIGRSDGKKKGEFCPIFYRKDRFSLIDSGSFWFSNKPEKPGSKYFATVYPRICSWVYLKDKNINKNFYVYNMHLDAFSKSARKRSAKVLAKQIASRKTKEPFLVIGDFNMKLDSPGMKYLQDIKNTSCLITDAWESVHPGKTKIGTRHKFTGNKDCPKIDHILISGAYAFDAKIDIRDVNGRYPSDHFPVVARIIFLDDCESFVKIKR